MSKTELTFSDVQEAIAGLMKRGMNPPERYMIILQGVELFLDHTSYKVHIHIPASRFSHAITVELEGSKALEWVADACREKAERDGVNEKT